MTLGRALDLVLEGDSASAVRLSASGLDDPRFASVAAFGLILVGRYDDAFHLATRASRNANDRTAAFTTAALTFARCMQPTASDVPDLTSLYDEVWALREVYLSFEGEDRAVAGYLAAESAMSSGRLVEAEELARALIADPGEGSTQSPVFVRIVLARSLAFQGRIIDALVAVAEAQRDADARGGVPARMLANATAAYLAAQQNDRAAVERLTRAIIDDEPDPPTYLAVASHVLAAYGLGAVDSLAEAARVILHAAGGPRLPRLQTVDRAYAYEILASDAIVRGDLDAAIGWGKRVAPLSIHDMAAAAVERTLSRIDTAAGRFESAAERAAISTARARVSGGRLDAARGEVLAARALAESGSRAPAIASLREAAATAERLGTATVRQWAASELRRLGHRLQPVAGSGLEALSKREQQITLLAAEGYSNRSIAAALYLSERTVQSHLSRCLVAVAVSSRAAIPASIRPASPPDFALFSLTKRQQEVAMLVIDGHPNRRIAQVLDISEKTVEKHIQGLFERLGVNSRTGVASRLLAPQPHDGRAKSAHGS